MEMVEQQNQPKCISPKRLKIDETLQLKEEEDRISDLPDFVILHLLSFLPSIKDAIRTGSLSKRWIYLWTVIPILTFKYYWFKQPTSDLIPIINKTIIQCRHFKLNKLEILMIGDDNLVTSHLDSWIQYATACKVEDLILEIFNVNHFPFYQQCFINSDLTNLILKGFILNPIGAIRWKSLRSLSISYTCLDEGLIQNILSGSPLLKTLKLESCYGFRHLDITSESVENLVISGYDVLGDQTDFTTVVEIIAPYILSLKILHVLLLWKVSLLNVSSLVEADLDYTHEGFWVLPNPGEEETFKGFMQSLGHIKEIKVGNFCTKVVSRLEAKGYVFPANMKYPVAAPIAHFDRCCPDYDEDDDYAIDSVDSEDWEAASLDHGSDDAEVI